MKTHKFITDIVELSIEDLPEEAKAAVSLNPTLRWIKFILTDAEPNFNGQRVPKEEFSNLIKSGIHMPIKMAQGLIRDGHEFAVPVGTITSLIERDDHIEGIAALWSKEFPNEVGILEDMASEGKAPQISWEILFKESVAEGDDVEALKDTKLRAATIVGSPAYEGRTPIVAMAASDLDSVMTKVTEGVELTNTEQKVLSAAVDVAKKNEADFPSGLDDIVKKASRGETLTDEEQEILSDVISVSTKDNSSTEEANTMSDELIDKLKQENDELSDENDTLREELSDLKEEVSTLRTEKEELASEKEELESFKEDIEAAREREEKIEFIRELFSDNGVELPEDYFEDEEKAEKLLSASTDQIEFLVQEMAVFASSEEDEDDEDAKASKHLGSRSKRPNLRGDGSSDLTPSEIADQLRKELTEEND